MLSRVMSPLRWRHAGGRRSLVRTCLYLALLGFVIWQWGSAVRIHGRAIVAQYLIAQSWQETLAMPDKAERHKPWAWADTWPVARLQWVGESHTPGTLASADLYVLAGANGSSLAFGPGHMDGTALPGEGASVIGGHRDTHFSFLQHLSAGHLLLLQKRDGVWLNYEVKRVDIVDSRKTPLQPDVSSNDLWLITCYPFNAMQSGGPLRYVVQAQLVEGNDVSKKRG